MKTDRETGRLMWQKFVFSGMSSLSSTLTNRRLPLPPVTPGTSWLGGTTLVHILSTGVNKDQRNGWTGCHNEERKEKRGIVREIWNLRKNLRTSKVKKNPTTIKSFVTFLGWTDLSWHPDNSSGFTLDLKKTDKQKLCKSRDTFPIKVT